MAEDLGAEVARLRRQLADLEQLSEVGFWEFDLATQVVEWSAGLRRLYGVGPDEVIDYSRWLEMVHPEDRDMVAGTIATAVECLGDYGFDHRFHRADDGALRWTRCRGRVATGLDGRATTIVGVSVDTTGEHRAAEQQAAFIANAAHELRTPAAAIGHALEVLENVPDRPVERAMVHGVLRRQATRLRHLAANLLDLTTLDAGPVAALLEPVPLAAAVRAAVATSGPEDTRIDVDGDLAVLADAAQLDQVLVNLLTNAVRYGGPTVTVTGRRSIGGDRVVLEVHDDGPGVPEDVVPDLFAPFRRGVQRHPEASGLGLAIVERMMRCFGGSVAYTGGDGRGATFVLEFDPA